MQLSDDHSSSLFHDNMQTAIGNYIALAADDISTSINVYENIRPRPVRSAEITAAIKQLTAMPLEAPPTAGSPPAHSRLPPFQRNPFFVGREEYFRQMASLLKEDQPPVLVLTGIGGIGKSQLVNEMAYRYGHYFAGGVFWLNFADARIIPTEVTACRVALQEDLRLTLDMFPLEQQVQLVLSAWQNDLPRLLILDNCEDERRLMQWRPPIGGSRVIATSQREIWAPESGLQVLHLSELQRDESIELLGKYHPSLTTKERVAIIQEVGNLPLALHLAGKYLDTYQASPLGMPATYLKALRTTPWKSYSISGTEANYPIKHFEHVARTFALSYKRLDASKKRDKDALMLLARAACFAPGEPLPRELLRATLGPADDRRTEETFSQAVESLLTLGLLEPLQQGSSYRLHRLLAPFVRQQRNFDAQAQTAAEQALLERVNDLNAAGYPAALFPLQTHLRVVTQTALQWKDSMAAELSDQLGRHLESIGAYEEALIYLQQALSIRHQILGEQHPDTAASLNNLAALYYAQGKYEQAELLYQQAIFIYQQVLGAQHPDTATSLNNLAKLYYTQGLYEQAEPLYQQALAIRRQMLGTQHADTATSLNNLAALYYTQSKYEQAEQLYQQALAIYQQVLGEQHPDTATSLNNLAALYYAQGRYKQAEPLYQQALAIYQQVFGEQHPDTATGLNNLATLYYAQGRYKRARPLYQQALAIYQQVLGEQHPDTATSLNNLAALYYAQGQYKQAAPLYQQALAIRRQMLGEWHPDTTSILAKMVAIHQVRERPGWIKRIYQRYFPR